MYELLLLLRNSHHNVAAVAVDVASKVDSQCTWPVTVEAIRRAVAVAVASKGDSASLLTGESIHRTAAVAVAVAVAFAVAPKDNSARSHCPDRFLLLCPMQLWWKDRPVLYFVY